MNHTEKYNRCPWAGEDPLYIKYHDLEWGVPVYDDRKLFEFLILEGAQAGLSWITVLRKRENYREAFDRFNPEKIAAYTPEKIAQLLQNPGIIRNRLKINAAVENARAFLKIVESGQSFSAFLWDFVDGRPIVNRFEKLSDLPAETEVSRRMSKVLKKQGFRFVGPTICYAFMQAVGMVNDHLVSCFRHQQLIP
ncbi:MAG: DNA-3-methyladenine glycosylase I [Calditrichia bacterium]